MAHPRWTLTACMLASSLAFIDGSVVNVALPSIGRSFGADAAELPWTISAYLLPLSALLMIGGAAGDRFGRRRLLLLGIGLFALASLGCAAAPSLHLLYAARALQGMGAAMLMPNSLGLLGNAFTGEARGRAIGTWASAGAIAAALGPPLGGWLVGAIGWRWIFFLNLPVALAGMAVVALFVGESRRGEQALDGVGALTATIGLGALTWGLTLWSARHQLVTAAGAGIAVGLGALGLFLRWEKQRGDQAMMPLALFGTRASVGLTVYTFLLYGALGGLLVLLPYVLQQGGYSPLRAGLALLPFPVLVGTCSRLVGRYAARIGPRWPLTLGPFVTACGFALLVRVDPAASYAATVLPGVLTLALGMAGAVAPLTTAVLSAVDDAHAGIASGFNSAIARAGGLVATALSGAVIAARHRDIVGAFHGAALVGAGLALAAAGAAFLTLDGAPRGGTRRP